MEDVLLHELIMGMPLLHSASKAFSEEVEGTPRPTKRGGAFRHTVPEYDKVGLHAASDGGNLLQAGREGGKNPPRALP